MKINVYNIARAAVMCFSLAGIVLPLTGMTLPQEQLDKSLLQAVAEGNAEQVKILLGQGADVNAREFNEGKSVLSVAVCQNKPDVVKILLQHPDINVNEKSRRLGLTPLHEAVCRRLWDIIDLLEKCPRVDANIRDNRGHTPLYYAFRPNQAFIVTTCM